jgi:hypothetical protein
MVTLSRTEVRVVVFLLRDGVHVTARVVDSLAISRCCTISAQLSLVYEMALNVHRFHSCPQSDVRPLRCTMTRFLLCAVATCIERVVTCARHRPSYWLRRDRLRAGV